MKIAVACDGERVAQHFGHCEGFIVFTTTNEKVAMKQFIQNPGHRPGFLPNYLNDLGVEVVISGGMGGGAIEIFNEKGIQVITGASGEAEEVINRFIEGRLKSSGSICHEHQHHGTCGG